MIKPLGREFGRLSAELATAQTMAQLDCPLIALKDYLKNIQ